MWMDHDERPRWAEGWDWTGYVHWPPVPSPVDDYHPVEQEEADERAPNVRRTQRDEREQRYLRREQRAEKYMEIEQHLRSRVIDPKTVFQLEKCYKTIINRASSNRENVKELWSLS